MATVLAMHMANELLSLPMAAATLVLAALAVGLAAWLAQRRLHNDRYALLGVLGAFIFAAQMINFTLPLMPGTSGHLCGAVLLAILLGPWAAIVAMTAILIVQCLIFQDGGLLALGCNIINMGVVPALAGWATYRVLGGGRPAASPARQYLAAWAACTLAVPAGAALVPLEAHLSGVLRVPVSDFLLVMLGVHLLIGLIEGAITFAVVAFLRQVRPALLGLEPASERARLGRLPVAGTLLATALLLAGVASGFASTHPDGLEWSYKQHQYAGAERTIAAPSPPVARVEAWQSRWTPLKDYTRRAAPLGQEPAPPVADAPPPAAEAAAWPNLDGWSSLAGLLGTGATLAVLYVATATLRRRPLGAAEPK